MKGPLMGRNDGARETGLRVMNADLGVRHQRRARVGDLPFQCSDGRLRSYKCAQTHE